jgi:hypothetical protein
VAEEDTEQLRAEQIKRAREEHKRAQEAGEPTEEHQHDRRSERAAYLAEKLEERAEAEERVEDDA